MSDSGWYAYIWYGIARCDIDQKSSRFHRWNSPYACVPDRQCLFTTCQKLSSRYDVGIFAGFCKSASNDSEASKNSGDSSGAAVTIDEQVLVDQDDIVVTATEYVTDVICCEL